ncbi:MAG: DUF2625 domain-containing protein [Bacteroidota bacterium]
MKIIFTLLAFNFWQSIFGQVSMKSIDELINQSENSWNNTLTWIDKAKNKVEILPADTLKTKESLFHTQVTTRSTMGGIVYYSGGLLIDNGWIRILGGGCSDLRSLPDWNKGKTFKEFGDSPTLWLIADDAAGGFFLLNGGALGDDFGKVYYLSPDNLEYEALDITYTEFILFCLNNDLDLFYQGLRWSGWKEEIQTLKPNEVFTFYPPLWSVEGKNINQAVKKMVPVDEQYTVTIDFRNQLLNNTKN